LFLYEVYNVVISGEDVLMTGSTGAAQRKTNHRIY